MKNGTIPFFSVFGKQKTGQSREKRDSWQVCKSQNHQSQNRKIHCPPLVLTKGQNHKNQNRKIHCHCHQKMKVSKVINKTNPIRSDLNTLGRVPESAGAGSTALRKCQKIVQASLRRRWFVPEEETQLSGALMLGHEFSFWPLFQGCCQLG